MRVAVRVGLMGTGGVVKREKGRRRVEGCVELRTMVALRGNGGEAAAAGPRGDAAAARWGFEGDRAQGYDTVLGGGRDSENLACAAELCSKS